MAKVNVVIVDATGNKEQKVGLPDDIKCGIIMVKLVEKIKLPSVGPDGNPISYKFIHKVTGRQLLETQTLADAGIKDGDVLRLQPEITAGAICGQCGNADPDGSAFCSRCGAPMAAAPVMNNPANAYQPNPYAVPSYTAAPVKAKVKGKISCVLGMLSGALSAVFGLTTLGMNTGYWESNSSYGGDAYTGIQNAAAQTANNVLYLSRIVAQGLGFLMIALGLIAILMGYFFILIKIAIDKPKLFLLI